MEPNILNEHNHEKLLRLPIPERYLEPTIIIGESGDFEKKNLAAGVVEGKMPSMGNSLKIKTELDDSRISEEKASDQSILAMDCGLYDSSDDSDDEHIVVKSSGKPDRFEFVTEIFVPKMRGFEDLSDRCILDAVCVPLALDQVVKSSTLLFNRFLNNVDLTDTQLEVTKYVRRRARNRSAARRCRLKKHTVLLDLMEQICIIRKKKQNLKLAFNELEHLKKVLSNKVETLQQHIVKELKSRGENSDLLFKEVSLKMTLNVN